MGKIITVTSRKGGVGKTTTLLNLAGVYSNQQKKVLILDLDLYCSGVSISLNLKSDKTIYNLILDITNHCFTEVDDYVIKYNEFISVPENFIELEIDNGVYWSPITGEKMPDEYVEIYAEKFNDYVESQIGPRPQNSYKYVIITNTGVKVNISKNKFDEINKIIDEKTKDKI